MDKLEYLLVCLGEECGEVQQAVGKVLRFGLYSTHPERDIHNLDELRAEVSDIVAVYEMLCEELNLSTKISREEVEEKKYSVSNSMKVSRRLGRL